MPKEQKNKEKGANLISLLKPYRGQIMLLVVFTIVANSFNLIVPKIIASAIDSFTRGNFVLTALVYEFIGVAIGIALFTYLQSAMQVFTAERVARDLRNQVVAKISEQDFQYVQEVTPAKLLTNLTSDSDSVKQFVSLAVASIISSIFLIIGASVLLIMIDWKLALAVLAVVPLVALTFYMVFSRVRKLFKKGQEAIDWLNKVISESILGSALIRLLNSRQFEEEKFKAANVNSRNIGLGILRLFSILIPVITFLTNIAILMILALGGHFVIQNQMSLGNFAAFNSYLTILIFPIFILGFMSNIIAQATASYQRIFAVLASEVKKSEGKLSADGLRGEVELKNISVRFGEKSALNDVSFRVKPGQRLAIIGPTAAGKTQLLYVMVGLLKPTSGEVVYDGQPIKEYDQVSLHSKVGLVFQDSIIFNSSLRENIAFNTAVTDEALQKAINTAELKDFIATLPEGLNTIVSERGSSLSGGQKQRIMLARALALNPRILLLDDFTARVDTGTEQKILQNIRLNYPDLTLVSVTQKISSIEDYDQIIVLMEGEMLALGTHSELMKSSPEYVQIYNSQQSTNAYELPAE